MRQRHRHNPPEGAGGLGARKEAADGSTQGRPAPAAGVEDLSAGFALTVDEGVDRETRPGPSVGSSLAEEPWGEQPSPGALHALRNSQYDIPDVPAIRESSEAELTADLARDLERLREASEQIARTSAWVERHSRETGVRIGLEGVESSRGLVLALPHPTVPAPPGGLERSGQNVEQDGNSAGGSQGAAPMKTRTTETTIAVSSPKDPSKGRTMLVPPTDAAATGQALDAPVMQGLDRQPEPDARPPEELEAELQEARDALRRLRERAELQARMYGTVGAQTRKLDQRAAELRARVAKAQDALNERARKLQGVLERERERLKAYHEKLRRRAKELNEWTQERKRRFEAELAAERAAIAAERQALARREAELERRLADIGGGDRQAIEIGTGHAAKEEALARREAALEARLREFESRRAAEESALSARAEEMVERAQGDDAGLLDETAALRQELQEQIESREVEWAGLREALAVREQGVRDRERAVEKAATEARERERAASERRAELDRRDADLARLSAAMEVREHRLQEWQRRIDLTEQRIESARQAVQEQAREAQRQADQHKALSADLEVRFEELQRGELLFSRKQAEAEALSLELRQKGAELELRSAEVDRLRREYEEQARLITEERRQFVELSERSDELDRQRSDLASRIADFLRREEAVNELERRQGEETAALDRAGKDLEALRGSLAGREQELEKREREIRERAQRVDEIERRLHQKAQDLSEQQAAFEEFRAEHAEALAGLEKGRESLAKQQLLLDEAQLALQIDRHRLGEQEQALEVGRRSLQMERDELAAGQNALLLERSRLEQAAVELGRRRDELDAVKARVEDERATLDRQAMAFRDRERALAERQSGLEAAHRETELARQELSRRVDEVETFRSQLVEKAAHLKARKEQLAKDAATVDERLRSLNAELGQAAEDRRSLRQAGEQLTAEREQLSREREQHAQEREELEQARRTFQAGLRSLDESRRHLAAREARLGEQAEQLESLRQRSETERAELQRQREELLTAQAEHGGAAGRVQALMAQAEAMRDAARGREEEMAAHEQAIAARTAELSRAEEELRRRRQELDARAGEIAAEAQALEARRSRQEASAEEARSAVEELRRDAEARIAAERAKLEERARAAEEIAAKHREAAAADEVAVSAATAEDVRKRIEAELADRFAEMAHQEEAAEARHRSRLEELDRDIAQRLAEFEQEIRERREQAHREIVERRRVQEEELRGARRRLDEQVEDLRRRQQAVAQEQSLLQLRKRECEDERRELAELRRRIEAEGGLAAEESPRSVELEQARWVAAAVPGTAAENGHDSELPRLSVGGPPTEPAQVADELVMELGEDELEVIPDEEAFRHDPRQAPWHVDDGIGKETAVETHGGESYRGPDLACPEHGQSSADADALAVRPGRFPERAASRRRAVRGGLIAGLAGCIAAGGYLLWLPADVYVRGRVVLNDLGASAPLRADEHAARMNDPAVLRKAGEIIGMDVEPLHRSGRITLVVAPAGDAVLLAARVPPEQGASAQRCLSAWGEAYCDSLQGGVVTDAERQSRLSELQAAAEGLQEQHHLALARLAELRSALQSDDRFNSFEVARIAKEDLKAGLAAARDELEAAKTLLAQAEAVPLPTDAVVPTEEQLMEACAADAELIQAMQQRDAQAREMHRVLMDSMSNSQIPLARLLTEINSLASEVAQQLAEQTDKDIRRELEQIAVDVGDYQRQAAAFSRSWDELAPKVAAWKAGSDAELLREYQRKAETLVRDFHSESGRSFGSAASKADAIGRAGTEMTKRRISQNRLLKASRVCLEARNEWIIAARGVVPRYNLELKALDEAVRDLTPRIEIRRAGHRERLAEHLRTIRADRREADLRDLRARVDAAAMKYQLLSDEFLQKDAQATADADLVQQLQKQQTLINEQERLVARIDQEATDVQREIDRLQSTAEVRLSGSVAYQEMESLVPGRLEPARRNRALALWGVVAGVFLAGFWIVTGWQRREAGRRDEGELSR